MYSKRLWLLSLCILSFIGIRLYATDNNVIVGWNDWAITNGAGTDGALDSPEHIENMMKRWKGRGFTGVYWRIEQKEGDPNAYIFSDAGLKPGTGELAAVADRLLSQFNVSEEAKNKAEAEGLEFWAWVPFIYSRGAPVTGPSGLPAGVTYDPWYGMDSYTYDHPETLFTNRSQTKARYMLSDYTDYGARISMVAWFEYFAEHYGFKNFLACMRTEDYQNYYNNDGTYYIDIAKGDEYGFNPEIVNLMLYCYDVNILTDSRFDVFSEAFDINDSMVENWRTIRGLYLTDLYRKIRQAMDVIDPNIKIGVQTPGGDYVGPTIGNIKLDWRTWINDGLIDEIVIPVALDNADDVDSGSKGYLTNARTGYGVLPVSTFRDFIDDSNNPDAKLIYAGGPYFHFTNPPAGTDGWRTDASTDAYYLSWYQRWRQLNQDIKDIGYIRFIDQDFNYFDVNDNGMAGGIGEVIAAWEETDVTSVDLEIYRQVRQEHALT